MNSPTFSTRAGVLAWASIVRTMAEPTATPSAILPTAPTCSGVETPKPTHTGVVLTRRRVRIWTSRSFGSSRRSPVVPVSDTT